MSALVHTRVALAVNLALNGQTVTAFNKPVPNRGYRGFKLTLNPSAGAGSVTGSVSEYDSSGNAIKAWSVETSGTSKATLEVYPALTTSGNVYNDVLGAIYNAQIVVSGALTLDAVLDLIP